MIECKKCIFYKERFVFCKKVLSYDPEKDTGFQDGITYARTDVQNEEGKCVYYKPTFLNKIKDLFRK